MEERGLFDIIVKLLPGMAAGAAIYCALTDRPGYAAILVFAAVSSFINVIDGILLSYRMRD